MKTPVLIAARNEANHIGTTLHNLDRVSEPIVLLNGCSDKTGRIAEHFGATVIDLGAEGKLPAIQEGIRYLGSRALEPFLTLDADSHPVFMKSWIPALETGRKRLSPHLPAVVTGPSIYTDMGLVGGAYKTLADLKALVGHSRSNYDGPFCGRNMLLDIKNEETLDRVLALPHYWPGMDVAMKDAIIQNGGETLKLIRPDAAVFTSGDRYPSLKERISLGRAATTNKVFDSYVEDSAPGSIPYPPLLRFQKRS